MQPIKTGGGNTFQAPEPLARPRPKYKERYRLLKLVGQGGTGAVYKAQDLELDRIIAIKLLHPMLAGDERYVDLLRREVVVASQITHPNIVRIFDVSALRKSPIITMAFIQGENLASLLRREGALATPRAVHLARQICAGLDEAHRRGVVHRDLKPQNLLIDHDSQLFVSDFGLAHSTNVTNYDSLGSGDRPGTLQYMSPEQFHALPFDSRSDLFSFGLILYEMLTGTALEVDHSATGRVITNRKTQEPVALPASVPASLAAVALRCLARDPAERFQTASDILASLPQDVFTATSPGGLLVASHDIIDSNWLRIRPKARAVIMSACGLVFVMGFAFWKYGTFQNVSSAASFEHLSREAASQLRKNDDPASLERAAELFQSAARINPAKTAYEGRAKAEIRLYQLTRRPQNLEEASSALKNAERLDRTSRSLALLNVELELARGAPAAAMLRLNRMLSSEPESDDVLRLLAKTQVAAGDVAKSVETWKRAVHVNPHNWANHNGLGSVLMKLGRPVEAEPEFRRVIELDPASNAGYANLGAAYVTLGQFEKAIPVTEKALAIRPTAEEYNNLGTALYYTGSYHASLPLFQKAVQLNSHSDQFASNLGEAYRCIGDAESAAAAYRDALRLAQQSHREAPNDARLTARLGIYFARLGNIDEGERLIASALKAAPDNPETWYSKAVFCVLKDQLSEGAAAAKTALTLGYSIKEAARDPELRPLSVDHELNARFKAELNESPGPRSGSPRW